MNQGRIKLLEDYFKMNITPVLVKDIPSEIFDGGVILKNDILIDDLTGHYEGTSYLPPSWYDEVINKSKHGNVLLVIENINDIPSEEQKKFVEILKYRKVSTFPLPDKCLIVVTSSNSGNSINEDVYTLLAQI